MAALLRAAAARAEHAQNGEGPQSNAVLRMLGKRVAERSPSVSPAKAERDSAPEPPEKVPFQLAELNEAMDELGQEGEPPAAEGKRSVRKALGVFPRPRGGLGALAPPLKPSRSQNKAGVRQNGPHLYKRAPEPLVFLSSPNISFQL